MKKNIFINLFLAFLFCLSSIKINAQTLYSENFDGLNVGNVGTDVSGSIKGQGGFLTKITGKLSVNSSDFRIELEPNRGKVLVIESKLMKGIKRNTCTDK